MLSLFPAHKSDAVTCTLAANSSGHALQHHVQGFWQTEDEHDPPRKKPPAASQASFVFVRQTYAEPSNSQHAPLSHGFGEHVVPTPLNVFPVPWHWHCGLIEHVSPSQQAPSLQAFRQSASVANGPVRDESGGLYEISVFVICWQGMVQLIATTIPKLSDPVVVSVFAGSCAGPSRSTAIGGNANKSVVVNDSAPVAAH